MCDAFFVLLKYILITLLYLVELGKNTLNNIIWFADKIKKQFIPMFMIMEFLLTDKKKIWWAFTDAQL